MAKAIITQSGDIVNYSNIVSISVEEGKMNDGRNAETYKLVAANITNQITVIGAYNSIENAEKAKAKIIKWLQSEIYGVYEVDKEEDD